MLQKSLAGIDDRLIAPMRDLFFTEWALQLTKGLGLCITKELQAKGPIPPPQLDLSQFSWFLVSSLKREDRNYPRGPIPGGIS